MRKFGWTSSLFTRLMLGFLLIILIVLFAQVFSYRMYINIMQEETITNTNERLDNLVSKLSKYFYDVHDTLVEASLDKAFRQVSNGGIIDNYDEKLISEVFLASMRHLQFVNNIVLLNKNSAFVVTQNGTFMKNEFFNQFDFGGRYTEDFWMKETTKNFTYRYYPAATVRDTSSSSTPVTCDLLPVAIKRLGNSNYIMIAFIDVNGLTESIEKRFVEDLYLFTEDRAMIYPITAGGSGIELPLENPSGFQKINNNLLFYKKEYGLSYYKIIPFSQITDELKPTEIVFLLVILVSFTASLVISVCLARRFNSPVKQILENMQKYELSGSSGSNMDLKLIKDNIQKVISQNHDYVKDISRKDAALKSLSYYARVKNINIGLNELLDEVVFPTSFVLIYFKVHYRKSYFSDIALEKFEGSLLIKELLQIYLGGHFPSVFMCQVESDQIIGIVESDRNDQGFLNALWSVLEKLKLENQYVYFTVSASSICDNVSELDKVYKRIMELTEYRRLNDENQVLTEEVVLNRRDKLYFNIDQSKQFINSLVGRKSEDCVAQMKSILAYNVKTGVSEFYIKLLAMEFINCCVKTLVELYFEVPEEFKVMQITNSLEYCSTLEEFEDVLQGLIHSVAGYMREHCKGSDYIIDFVKKYINENYANDISLEMIADKLNITKNYLSAYFKNKAGVNLSDYINGIRIKKSIELMKDPAVMIHEASAAVGIPNTNTFIRLFRKHTGKAPREYRRSQI